MSPAETVTRVFAEFAAKGHRSYGENVTELQHALQSAHFARQFGETEEIVAACLLHDFGHLVQEMGEDVAARGIDAGHERLGAAQLETMFGPEISEPARLHVDAKRYLCWKNSAYYDGLSEASKLSLQLQGGPMTDAEAREFESNPHHDAAVRVRRYDDMGKVPDLATAPLEDYRALLERLVNSPQ
jgi:phosphonate degradation associated HDIG domain protein